MRTKLKLLLLAAMLMPVWQQSLHAIETLTVCNDASTACHQAPLYGGGFDEQGTESQMIYPSSMLATIPVGSSIKSVTFYPCKSGTLQDDNVPNFGEAEVELRMGETSQSTIVNQDAMMVNRQSGQLVYHSTLPHESTSKSLTINLSSGYIYQGGNLIIDFYLSKTGTSHSTYWHAKAISNGAAYYCSNSESGPALGLSNQVVLPKMTITYDKPEYSAVASPANNSTIDFGKVYVGTTATQSIVLTNEGSQSITPGVTVDDQGIFTASAPEMLAEGATATIPVAFTPTAIGSFNTTMRVVAYDGKVFNYTLTGQGTDDPALSVTFQPGVLDFGIVNAEDQPVKQLTIINHGTDAIEGATMYIEGKNSPFSFPQNISVAAGGQTTVDITFSPSDASSYNQMLWFEANGCTYETTLRGIGMKDGAKAIRDRAFFEGKTYTWKVNNEGAEQTSNLAEVATDPDQMIALFRKVYMDKDIPGNWHRGYTADNELENYYVDYAGVGTMTGANTFTDSYGWGIPGTVITNANGKIHCLDPEQYKPNYDGVTLLLVEVKDGVQLTEADTENVSDPSSYAELRDYCDRWFKSVRVVTESMIVGEGTLNEGTLFKVDCNQMNRFFFLAKGHLRSFVTQISKIGKIEGPFWGSNSYVDVLNYGPFYHMFEQLSAYDLIGDQNATDIYQELVMMKTYKVEHDCISIPKPYNRFVDHGEHATFSHEFNMYGRESVSADCQDVRDLMFLVPTHRMTQWHDNENNVGRDTERGIFVNYHDTYAPLMGLFAIIQDPIVGQRLTDIEHMYQLTLQWRSNLLDFVPDGGKYQLYQVINENGVERYKPVYKQYIDDNNQVVTTTEPIYVDAQYKSTDETPERYTPIYIPMQEHGQQVTFAIKAIDSEEFLALQMSNKRSYIIPGYNLAEKLELHIGDDYTSRFDPQAERNCYSNQVIINGYTASIAKSFLSTNMQDQFTIVRTARTPQVDLNGDIIIVDNNIQYDEAPTTIAHATVTSLPSGEGTGTLRIDIDDNTQTAANLFPKGKDSGEGAGYHQNPSNSFEVNFVVKRESEFSEPYVYFWNNDTEQKPTFTFYDNFHAETATNAHPTEYVYQAFLTTAHPFQADENDQTMTSSSAVSNKATVHIHKTDMDMAGVFSLRKVQLDGTVNHQGKRYLLPNAAEFSIDVKFSPKSEVLRYDAYRWDANDTRYIIKSVEDNGDEEDIMPTGSADNNVGMYTVKMDGVPQTEVVVPTDGSTIPAPFRDDFVMANGGDYIYAPVVETFSGDITKYSYYNTYGAPLKKAVAAPIQVQISDLLNTDEDHAMMSKHSWTKDGNIYCYYNIPLQFTQLEVPDGYDIYKVRAWRLVDPENLGEEKMGQTLQGVTLPDRSERISEDYLFEDMNWGTDMGNEKRMTKEQLSPDLSYELGSRMLDASVQETVATFGAKRLDGVDGMPGSITKLEADFIVRIYFTPKANPGVGGQSSSNSPRRATGVLQEKDFDYYVSEATVHFNSNNYDTIITGVNDPVEDRGRDIVGVSYVSPMGQVSSRPFAGVNIILTRYSDGTTSTRKVIR